MGRTVERSGFEVWAQDLGFWIWFRVKFRELGTRNLNTKDDMAQAPLLRHVKAPRQHHLISGFVFRGSGFGLRVSGFGFRVSGFGFRVESLKFRA